MRIAEVSYTTDLIDYSSYASGTIDFANATIDNFSGSGGGGSVSGAVPVVTEWTSFEMTIEGTTSNPTKATTPTIDQAYYRRVGDTMEIVYTYRHTDNTGAANGSGSYLFKLPSGFTIDTTKLAINADPGVGVVGPAGNFAAGVGSNEDGFAYAYNSQSIALFFEDGGTVGSASRSIAESTISYTFSARVPIATWDASDTSVATLGAAISDWTSFTMNINATTTAPSKGGTIGIDKAQWRRVGDSMEITWSYNHSSAGSNGSGTYLFEIPAGYTIDTGKIHNDTAANGNAVVGMGNARVSASYYDVIPYVYDSNYLALFDVDNNVAVSSTSATSLGSTVIYYSFTARVPIVGWSNNVTLSDGASIEYAHNTDTTNADTTASGFSNTSNGSLVPVVATSAKRKRVRFNTPVLNSDKVVLQILDNNLGAWIDAGDSRFSPQIYDTNVKYGVMLQAVSATDYDVYFLEAGAISQGTGSETWTTENSNGTRWRVVKAASQIPVQIETDNIAAIGDWQPFSMTIDATTTAPTKATTRTEKAYWRRVGDSMEVMWSYFAASSVGAAAGTGEYIFRLPRGYTIDTSKAETESNTQQFGGSVGTALVHQSGSQVATGNTFVYDNNSVQVFLFSNSGPTVSTWSSTFIPLTSNNLSAAIAFTVPIVGWSSNLTLSDDAQVEYLYNTDTTNADNTSAFATGPAGVLVPVVATSAKEKRVRASRNVSNASLVLQFQENGIGPWVDAGDAGYNLQGDELTTTPLRYGARIIPISNTDLDISFAPNGVNRTDSSLSWSTENGNGTRWRVKVVYNPSSVEAPENSQVVYLKDVKSTSTNGGTFTSGSDQTRVLNTLEDPSSLGWCSLASNQFTLQAGTYEVEWETPAYQVNRHRSKIYNVSDSTDFIYGQNAYCGSTADVQTISVGKANFTIAASKIFEIRHRCEVTATGNGFGVSFNNNSEVYTQVKIRKLS